MRKWLSEVNKRAVGSMDRRFYPGVPGNWDNDMFREWVLEIARPEDALLDIGAGRGALKQMDFRGVVAESVGVDPDPVVEENPFLDEAIIGGAEAMHDLRSSRFDIVVTNNVLEHVPDPEAFFAETARVMKPGARLIAKTPNLYHYMATIARFSPTSFHELVTKMRGRPVEDTFPTRYLLNTRSSFESVAADHGFEIERYLTVESRPEYLRMTPMTYLFGIAYERLVNRLNFDDLRIVIFVQMRKV